MNIIDYSIKNRVVTLFFTAIIFIGGLISYFKVGKLEDPEFRVKEAIVLTVYPGASPHQVELEVTNSIENALQAIPNVEYIESVSKANFSEVKIKLSESLKNEEIDQYWDNVRKKVNDAKSSLPSGTLAPIVLDDYGDVYGMFLAITSDGYSKKELDKYASYIKRELQSIHGVSKTTTVGNAQSAIEVVIDRDKLSNFGLNDKILMASFIGQSLPAYTPSLTQGGRYVRVNIENKFNSIEEIENFVVFSKPGKNGQLVVRVKDIADVKETYVTPQRTMMRYNEKEAIGIMLSPEKGTNVIDTGKAIDKKIAEIKKHLPIGIEVEKVYYQPDLVASAINIFVENLLMSVAVVIGMLLFTMGMRTGLIIGSGLVLSILGTIIFMLAAGIDMQRVSLGSFIIAMGMLVDNSIVIADGILVGFENKEDRFTALTKTAKKTAIPLLGATSIAIIAFLPMYLMPTDAGQYVSSLFWIMAVSLGLSWVLALTQTPVFCDLYLKVDDKKKENSKKEKFYNKCREFLIVVLNHRKASVAIIGGAFICAALLFFKLPLTFFPDSDKKGFLINVWTPVGTTIDATANVSKILEKELLKDEKVESVTASIGASPSRYYISTIPELPNESLSQLIITVKDLESIDRIGDYITKYTAKNIPDVKVQIKKYINGVPTKYPIELRILGPDPEVLRDLSEQAMAIFKNVEGTAGVQTDWKNKVLTWTPEISQQNQKKTLVTPFDVGNAFSRATNGFTIGKYMDGTNQLPILLKESVGENDLNMNSVGQLPVWGLGPSSVPLNQFVTYDKLQWENPEIWRRNGVRAIKVQCDVEGKRTPESIRKDIDKEIKKMNFPDKYSYEWSGEYYEQDKNIKAVLESVPLQCILMFSICVLLFATLKDPIIIFAILPLSFIGIVPGLFLTNRPFGFMSIIGAISLSGMMIKNSIVLIDEIKYEIYTEKKDPYTAILDSAVSRIRPVTMTSATTIFGMLPLIFDPLYGDMAITIIFGLTASTILTLFVVPLLYAMFYKIEPQK